MEPMRQKRIPATLTSVALFATLGLTACTTNTDPTPPQPQRHPTPDTTPESQPEPTETPTTAPTAPSGPPEKPAAMANNNEEGALAAAEYFLDASAYALLMGDKILMEDFSTDTCIFCSNVVELIKNDRKTQAKRLTMSFTFNEQPSIEHKHGIWVI